MRARFLLLLFGLWLASSASLRAESGPGGTVTLPLEEYLRLSAPAASPGSPVAAPSQLHFFSNGRYSLEADREWVEVDARVDLNLQADGWREIPLMASGVVLARTTLDDSAVPVYEKEGTLRFLARGRGLHRIRMVYHVPLVVEGAARSFEFRSLAGAPGTARMLLPGASLKIDSTPPLPLELSPEGGRTLVRMPLPGAQGTKLSWSPRASDPGLSGEARREKARLSARLYGMSQVSEREIRSRLLLECTIQRNQVDSLVLGIPPGAQVAELSCPGLTGWEVLDDPSGHRVHLALSKPVSGNLQINLTLESPLANPDSTWELPRLELLGAESSRSWVGVSASEALELTPADTSQGIRRTDPSQLPPQVLSLGTRPPVLAFESHSGAWSVRVESRLGRQVPLLTAAVDEASGQTLVTPQGRTISTFTWQLRNNQNQYLKVLLPEGARIWSAFVDGQAIKPVQEGPLLKLPLISSRHKEQELASFPVEITFVGAETGRAWLGSARLEAPLLPGVPTSQLSWAVYLPRDWKTFGFSGSVEPSEEGPSLPAPPVTAGQEEFLRSGSAEKRKSQDRPAPAPQAAAPGVAADEAEMDGKGLAPEDLQEVPEEAPQSAMAQMVQTTSQGSFPVRVRVPLAGRGHRFTQLMVGEESPTLRVRYYRPQLLEAAWWGAGLIALAWGLGLAGRPEGWKKLAGGALALILLAGFLDGTPAAAPISGALAGLALPGLGWLWRQRGRLFELLRRRRSDPPPPEPEDRPEQEVAS